MCSFSAPAENWRSWGGCQTKLAHADGVARIEFALAGAPPAGSNYVLDAYVVRGSEDWTKATVKIQASVPVGDPLRK